MLSYLPVNGLLDTSNCLIALYGLADPTDLAGITPTTTGTIYSERCHP